MDSFTFFYDDSIDDFNPNYLFKFGKNFHGNFYLDKNDFRIAQKELFVVTDTYGSMLDLKKIAAIIVPKYDDVGVFGKMNFIDTLSGNICKQLSEYTTLKLKPHGHCNILERNRLKVLKDFVLTGFVLDI